MRSLRNIYVLALSLTVTLGLSAQQNNADKVIAVVGDNIILQSEELDVQFYQQQQNVSRAHP
jgi:hypothetical protein